MRLFTEITNWTEYLGTQLAIAEVDERYAEATLDKGKIILKVNLKSTAGRDDAAQNEELWEMHDHYQEKMSYRKLVEVLYTNMDRKASLLSRELTRRVNRSDREGRRDKYNA